MLRSESDPKPEHMLRFVCLSDTHTRNTAISVPPGDVLLHTGDFTSDGRPKQVRAFNRFLATLPFRYKVVIAGNHDMTFDTDNFVNLNPHHGENVDSRATKALLTNCTYLEDSGIEILGYRIWGSPWTPKFFNWAFNLPRGPALAAKWALIPSDTDIIMTHSPPNQLLDTCFDGTTPGCQDLRERVEAISPLVHVFGHVHEAYGWREVGNTLFINAAICDIKYKAVNKPVIFDLPVR
jgi:predicted phosphohydrolase